MLYNKQCRRIVEAHVRSNLAKKLRTRKLNESRYTGEAMCEKAVNLAFRKCSDVAKSTIASWYYEEGAFEDFESVREFALFIKEDIEDMLTASPDEAVIEELVKKGYLDEDWLEDMEEGDL